MNRLLIAVVIAASGFVVPEVEASHPRRGYYRSAPRASRPVIRMPRHRAAPRYHLAPRYRAARSPRVIYPRIAYRGSSRHINIRTNYGRRLSYPSYYSGYRHYGRGNGSGFSYSSVRSRGYYGGFRSRQWAFSVPVGEILGAVLNRNQHVSAYAMSAPVVVEQQPALVIQRPPVVIQLPPGFVETERRYHKIGSDVGELDWIKAADAKGGKVKIYFNADGSVRKRKYDN